MSYSVIHMQKLKIGAMKGIENHIERIKESKTNPDIDYEKSHLNKNLLEDDNRTYYMRIKDRINELDLPKAIRKDAVVSCNFICTSDKAFFEGLTKEQQDKFFQLSNDFLKNRYGEKNIISSVVHYDETTPHLHSCIVPVTPDGRLSAKDIFNPKELRSLQEDYNRTMKEQGFNLDKGENQRKHLDTQEYKLETKFAELKEKSIELERLENIDKSINLEVEKGKLGYSAKEVETLKEQNKSLKIELYKTKEQLTQQQRDVNFAENRLLKAQKEIENIKVPYNRLKDLENENRALESYKKTNPQAEQSLKHFDVLKNQAYDMGKELVELKKKYISIGKSKDLCINETYSLQKQIEQGQNLGSNIKKLENDINISMSKEKALQTELDGLKGIFKGKQRKELTSQFEEQKNTTERLYQKLMKNHNVNLVQVPEKLNEYNNIIKDLEIKKAESIEKTDKLSSIEEKTLDKYKYNKALADCQNVDFKEITNRINDSYESHNSDFNLTKSDKDKILQQFEKTQSKEIFDTCKENFSKVVEKTKTMSRGLELEF